jgi:hypothetical protein
MNRLKQTVVTTIASRRSGLKSRGPEPPPDPGGCLKFFNLCMKKEEKKMGGRAFGIRDLLSREASVAWIFRRLQCNDTKIIAVVLIVIADVSTAIYMYRVSRNVEAGKRVLEHGRMALQDVPIILRDTITSLTPVNRGELERTMDESVQVCDVEPFPKRAKLVPCSIVLRSIGRAD